MKTPKIRSVFVDNFKSLVDFKIELADFNCIIGSNGVGKSTVLQAFSFLSALMSGKVEEWLEKRNWTKQDIKSKFKNKQLTSAFEVIIEFEGGFFRYRCKFNHTKLSCTSEELVKSNAMSFENSDTLFEFRESRIYTSQTDNAVDGKVYHKIEGSVLSSFADEMLISSFPEGCAMVVRTIRSMQSMDLLNPQLLRMLSRGRDVADIGVSGERIASFINRLSKSEQEELLEKLRKYFPTVTSMKTRVKKAGWTELLIGHRHDGIDYEFSAGQVNDGLLRILGVLSQEFTDAPLICFDEVENGVSIDIIEKLVNAMIDSEKQLIVTTNSIVVLNFIPDDISDKSILFVYRNEKGYTRVKPLLSVEIMKDTLDYFQNGDALMHVSLAEIERAANEQFRD